MITRVAQNCAAISDSFGDTKIVN